jgi:hypothetical protein
VKPILYTGNLVEEGVLTSSGAALGRPVSRVGDGDIGLFWVDSTSGAGRSITLDLGVGIQGTADTWSLAAGHNLAGVACHVQTATTTAGPWTTVSSTTPFDNATVRVTMPATTARCFRFLMDNPSAVPSLSEWVLAKALTLPSGPQEPSLVTGLLGNVQSYDSQGGYTWTRKKGPPRWEGTYQIRDLTLAQRGDLEAAFTASDEGARPFYLEDADGILRWVYWITDGGKLAFQAEGITRWRVTLNFREGL